MGNGDDEPDKARRLRLFLPAAATVAHPAAFVLHSLARGALENPAFATSVPTAISYILQVHFKIVTSGRKGVRIRAPVSRSAP